MSTPHSRFLMELDAARKTINRQVLSPKIDRISIADIEPTLRAVAHARAEYISAFMRVADNADPAPTPDMIADLKRKREAFDELVLAANALEQVIQRDYIDVVPATSKNA